MKTIQMTLDDNLFKQVDSATKELKTTRSAFLRTSIKLYLRRLAIKEMEEKHREGYQKHPVQKEEFDVWEDEQAWG